MPSLLVFKDSVRIALPNAKQDLWHPPKLGYPKLVLIKELSSLTLFRVWSKILQMVWGKKRHRGESISRMIAF